MFTLPVLALSPALNGYGVGVLPIVDGALYGWFLVATLIVAALGILSTAHADRSGRANRPAEPGRREPAAAEIRSADVLHKVAA